MSGVRTPLLAPRNRSLTVKSFPVTEVDAGSNLVGFAKQRSCEVQEEINTLNDILNMLSDVRSWKKERRELVEEIDKLQDRIDGLDDDVSTTTSTIHQFLNDLVEDD